MTATRATKHARQRFSNFGAAAPALLDAVRPSARYGLCPRCREPNVIVTTSSDRGPYPKYTVECPTHGQTAQSVRDKARRGPREKETA